MDEEIEKQLEKDLEKLLIESMDEHVSLIVSQPGFWQEVAKRSMEADTRVKFEPLSPPD